jgi:nicotinamidase-related amidase
MAKKIIMDTRYYSTGMEKDGSYDINRYAYRYETQELDFDKTAFFLIDVYGRGYDDDFTIPVRPSLLTKKSFYQERDIVRNKIVPALNKAREAGLKIIYVTNYEPCIKTEDSEFGKLMKRSYCIDISSEFEPGAEAIEFSEIIKPKKGEYLIKKQMYGGFFHTCLDSLLRNLEVKNLITVGFDTNICLRATVEGAFYRNYRVILLRDCTQSCEFPETEENLLYTQLGIKFIEWNIGYTATSDEFIESLEKL